MKNGYAAMITLVLAVASLSVLSYSYPAPEASSLPQSPLLNISHENGATILWGHTPSKDKTVEVFVDSKPVANLTADINSFWHYPLHLKGSHSVFVISGGVRSQELGLG